MNTFIIYGLVRFKTNKNGEVVESGCLGFYTESAMRHQLESSDFVDLAESDPCFSCAEYAANSFSTKTSNVKIKKVIPEPEGSLFEMLGFKEEEPKGFDRYFYLVKKVEVKGDASDIDKETARSSIVIF